MMLEWVMEVVYMEVDKVVDEVAKIKVDKVANMVMKKEGFADLTLTIDDTCGDGWVVMGVVDMEVANMVKWNLSKKWKGAMAHDVSPVAMFLIPNTESVLIVNLFFYRRRSWTTWMSGMIISSVRSSLHHNVPL